MKLDRGVDFDALLSDERDPSIIEPVKLFESLPNKAKGYNDLRYYQGEVLRDWHTRRSERDLVIKVNTGGGKTIVGLMILQSLLNEGKGPALYVAPDNYLVNQVELEAKNLGLRTTRDPDSYEYLNSSAIGIVNIHKLVNGKSIFSKHRSPSLPAPIGSVIIDDAHAALATTREQFAIKLDAEHPAFNAIFRIFEPDLIAYNANDYDDIKAKEPNALARIPFWSWRKHARSVASTLQGFARQEAKAKANTSKSLLFAYPAIRDVLHLCRGTFSGTELTISPPCPPIAHVKSLVEAKHRIYLTATLADDGILVTDFDADPSSIEKPISPSTAGNIGERMILAPLHLNPDISEDDVKEELSRLAQSVNVVVLCPSNKSAEKWKDIADYIVDASNLSAAVKRLTNPDQSPQLTVLINKYDGIDLPDDACRVLVIDGLPEAFSPEERLESRITRRTVGTDGRQIQRLEQGMGRAVRSNEDYCLVLLLGPRLNQLISHPETQSRFGPATRRQIEMAHTIAANLEGSSLEEIMATAYKVLDRDPGWVKFAKKSIASVPPDAGNVPVQAIACRRAFDAAARTNYSEAERELRSAIDLSQDDRERGWLLDQVAAYIDQQDPERAQEILQGAHELNSDVTRPLAPAAYRAIALVGAQESRLVLTLKDFQSPTEMVLAYDSVADRLQFGRGDADVFEEAFMELGNLLGLPSHRPEKMAPGGFDNLWSLGEGKYWVVEAKSESSANVIHKNDTKQLSGAVNWFWEHYPEATKSVPILVHCSQTLHQEATAVPGMRVLTVKGTQRLVDKARKFARAVAASHDFNNESVGRLLKGHGLKADQLDQYLSALAPR